MWGLSQTKTKGSAEKVKVRHCTKEICNVVLKRKPLRGLTVPLLLVLRPLLAEITLFYWQMCTSLSSQGRASTAQMGCLAAHLILKLATVAVERGPSSW